MSFDEYGNRFLWGACIRWITLPVNEALLHEAGPAPRALLAVPSQIVLFPAVVVFRRSPEKTPCEESLRGEEARSMSRKEFLPAVGRMSLSRLLISCLLFGALALAGCGGSQARYRSNVIEFLYGNKESLPETVPSPSLSTPFKLGIAFVPDGTSTVTGAVPAGGTSAAGPRHALILSDKQKADLMEMVSASLKTYSFVKSVDVIPSQYLVFKGGFSNLDQISSMYGLDVIMLLSYDQVQHTDEGMLSIVYWTIIGAYVVEGEKNDTSTMIDAAVFHIPARRLLFRSSGTSHIKATSTPVNLSEQLRKDSYAGFEKAIVDLTGNLKEQLQLFKERVEKGTPARDTALQ